MRARDRASGKVGWFCIRVSPGCKLCYAARFNERLGTSHDYSADKLPNVELFLDHKMLEAPLRWRRPRMVFVCSMTDLFADFVSDEWIKSIFSVIEASQRHTYQVLTKRPERMLRWVSEFDKWLAYAANTTFAERFKHVWLGVSCEDQKTADERIPLLLQTPAAVRWVSYEPALGPVDFTRIPNPLFKGNAGNALTYASPYAKSFSWPSRIDWIVVGGESGPNARPFQLSWARSVVAQCRNAGIPCFVKQLGSTPRGLAEDRCGFYRDRKGGDWNEWPKDLRVRDYPA